MTNLNLGQDVANNREKIGIASNIVAKSYFLEQAVKMCCFGSLIDINPSVPIYFPSNKCILLCYIDDTMPSVSNARMYMRIF